MSVYSRKALAASGMAYRAHLKVSTRMVRRDRLRISLEPRQAQGQAELSMLALEFWNHYLAATCDEKVG